MSVEPTEEQLLAQAAGATPTPVEPVRLSVQSDPAPEPVTPQPAPALSSPPVDPTAAYQGPVDANGPIVAPSFADVKPQPEPEVESKEDLEVILPVTIENLTVAGIPVTVNRLKSREFFALIRVFTTGLGSSFDQFDIDTKDPKQLAATVSAMAVFAIPNALEEFIFFCNSVVTSREKAHAAELAIAMHNPEVEDLLDIVSILAEQEAADFLSLVKKAQAAMKMMPQRVKPRQTGR